MSTARAHFKEEKHPTRQHDKEHKTGHAFRNALLISLTIAALILWQLNAIIHGLNVIQSALGHAEGTRRVIGGLLGMGYHQLTSTLTPLIDHISH